MHRSSGAGLHLPQLYRLRYWELNRLKLPLGRNAVEQHEVIGDDLEAADQASYWSDHILTATSQHITFNYTQ